MTTGDEKIYRVLDANCNRLKEGLRVIEDTARFILDDEELAGDTKEIRHQVTKIILKLPQKYRKLVESRDSESDVGRGSVIHDQAEDSIETIIGKNFKRAQESSRVIEEYLKILDQNIASEFQEIRFQTYDLEKKNNYKNLSCMA